MTEWMKSYNSEMNFDHKEAWLRLGVLLFCVIAYLWLAFIVSDNIDAGQFGKAAFHFMSANLFLIVGMKQVR